MFAKEWQELNLPDIDIPLYYFLHSPNHVALYKDEDLNSWESVYSQGKQSDAPHYITQFHTRIDDRAFGTSDDHG